MLHIHIITLGKLKESYWREAEGEYLKRLKPLLKISLYELKEESFSEKDPVEIIKSREAEKLKSVLERFKNAYVVALDEQGKEFSSVELSRFVEGIKSKTGDLALVIGGPLGLHKSIRNLAQTTISLSKLTFTHQMVRIVLLEQLYRSQMIAGGRKYHY
jgi:23S rRNA (pseudouridine1915-N3)-methyltransferase